MRRFLRTFIILLLIAFMAIQFYPRPAKNKGEMLNNHISKVHNVPSNVSDILRTSCYDCHSNMTRYPWYSSIQPVSMWLGNHIVDGKRELNFSDYATYSIRKRFRKMEEIYDEVNKDNMPLASYTLIHRDAILNEEKKKIIESWATAIIDSMRQVYPPDSLVRKK